MANNLTNVGISTKAWAMRRIRTCFFREEDESTNLWAKATAVTEESPVMFLTNHQSNGRGRGSNTWDNSDPGHCLLASWKFQLTKPVQHIAGPIFGLGLYNAARAAWPSLNWSLKPPNDLYLGSAKIAGLLIESVLQGDRTSIIVGLGFNVLSAPAGIPNATWLASHDGLKGVVEIKDWYEFLTQLDQIWESNLPLIAQTTLTDSSRQQLVHAINLNPHRTDPVLEITPDGDLIMKNSSISWKNL